MPAESIDDVLEVARERMPGWAYALLKTRVEKARTETGASPESVSQAPAAPKRGLMIALMLPEAAAKVVAQEGGEPVDRMHCTLAYPGKLEDLPADALERATAAVQKVCDEFAPFVGTIGGVGRFNASHTSDGKDVVHATVDAPVLPVIQQAIMRALDDAKMPAKREHGFDPHVTLAYKAKDADEPLPKIPTLPVVFDRISVVAGDKRHADVPLRGVRMHKGLTDEELADVERETAQIKASREGPEARRAHDFKAAKWTHKNGHPRCSVCGQEEPVSGTCDAYVTKADWTTAYVNDLPDSAFLYVEPGGEKDDQGKTVPRSLRHFPVRGADGKVDLPHLRNALSRIPQSKIPAEQRDRATAHGRAMLEELRKAQSETGEELAAREYAETLEELDDLEKGSPTPGDVHVPAPAASVRDRLDELEKAGLSRAGARSRVRAELGDTGMPREEATELVAQAELIEKTRPMSREYLEEAWKEARKLLPPWAWAMIHEQAMPRSGSRAKAERDDAPGALDRVALSSMSSGRLAKLSNEDLSEVWDRLGSWHSAAKRRRRDPSEVVGAAVHVSNEMARRGLSCASPLLESVKQSRASVTKGLPNETPEIGIHLHNLEREGARTKTDGAHAHLFVLEDGTEFWTEEDGAHAHGLPSSDAPAIPADPATGGLHTHRVILSPELAAKLGVPEGTTELVTMEDGLHGHQLQVWSSAFDGIHVHELKLPDGSSIRNLTPGQYWEAHGRPPMAELPPAPPASEVAKEAPPEIDVPTCGPEGADVLFVGASPDAAESARGEPFVGAAGETLNETYLAPLGLKRAAVAMSNAVPVLLKSEDGKAREPSPDEVHAWSGWLRKEIERVKPRAIVALGKTAEAAIDIAIGLKPDLTLPHPSAVRRFGNSGEVERKLRRAADIVSLRKSKDEHVRPASVEKAELSSDAAPWGDDWHNALPKSGKGRFAYQLGDLRLEVEGGAVSIEPLVAEGVAAQKDSGTYELGVAREDAVEIFLDGKSLAGRYMIQFAPVAGRRQWLIDKPEDQTPEAERRDLADLTGELKRKRQRYLIWAKPGQAPQKIDVMTGRVIKSALVPLLKERTLADKRIVYGVVLDPYIVDAHQDWVPPDVIEETAHRWFKGSRMITLHHKTHAEARAVESSLVEYPSQHDYAAARLNEPHRVLRRKFGDDVVHSGSWIIGVELSPELWEAYQRDEIAAFSIEGFGMRTPTTRKAMPNVTYVDVVEVKPARR